jgi:dTDP-4-dehydrorhamnose reductase
VRVIVTGAGGALGRDVVATCEQAGDEVVAYDRARLDVTDRDAVLGAITTVEPDAVVHCAAWTDVDGCESDRDRAWAANALAVRHVADGCAIAGARLGLVSTDYVFDGGLGRPYTEWDATGPLSAYGQSKLGGEGEARALGGAATIVRTSWLCGRHGKNFVKSILGALAERDHVEVVDDQHGCPTFTEDLAVMIRSLVVARRPGVFHVTNQGATTWWQLARDVAALAGLDPERVRPIATVDLRPARPAPRPANSVLDNAALRLGGLPLLADHHEPLERLVKELVA